MSTRPTSPTLKLSIWRNIAPNRALALQDDDAPTRFVTSDVNLQEEVYSWSLREYPFSGIEDADLHIDLHDKLFDKMKPSRPPSQRPLALLDEFADAALEAVESGEVRPVPVQNLPDGDDDTVVEMNTLLALALHLKWLSRCFAGRPGMSVSIR